MWAGGLGLGIGLCRAQGAVEALWETGGGPGPLVI